MAEAQYDPHYLAGIEFFNQCDFFEAHEAWEALWHACERRGPTADFLKGLIKLAAAGVKAREGRAAGVRRHALRATELLRGVEQNETAPIQPEGTLFGMSLPRLIAAAEQLASQAEELAGTGADARRRLPLVL